MPRLELPLGQTLKLSVYEVIALRALFAEMDREPRELVNTVTLRIDGGGEITAEAHYEDGLTIGVTQYMTDDECIEHDAWETQETGEIAPTPCATAH